MLLFDHLYILFAKLSVGIVDVVAGVAVAVSLAVVFVVVSAAFPASVFLPVAKPTGHSTVRVVEVVVVVGGLL